MGILRTISRVLVGLVFIFSGFVKAVDPLGSTYKFTDYFNAFGFEFMAPLALPLAVLMSSVEVVLGISLLYGYRMRVSAWALLSIMSFFTILTFVIALTDPVSDCGCFGDAVIMTNWQTFIKNIVLIFFTLIIFINRDRYKQIRGPVVEWPVIIILFIGLIFFSLYNYNHLPLLDFRPFSKGSDIVAGMKIPEGAPEDVYETKLIYKNKATGKEKEFSIESIPDVSEWEFISSESKIITKGYEPPIHDFHIVGPNGEEITNKVLQNPGYTFLLISDNLNLADENGLKKGDDFYKIAQSLNDTKFYALTASTTEDALKIKDSLRLNYDFSSVDEILLKTVIRSNPGLLLIKNGIVIEKWHYNDFPHLDQMGTEFRDILRTFPLSPGVILDSLRISPIGSRPDTYRTVFTYLNTLDGRSDTFPEFMIQHERNWEYLNASSVLVKKGSELPLSDFLVTTYDGEEISEQIMISPNNTFLVIAMDPGKINSYLLERINFLTTLTGEIPAIFYGLTNMKPDQVKAYTDTFISPIIFCSTPSSFIEKVAGDGICLAWIQKGRVAGIWKDDDIPLPENFEQILSKPATTPVFEIKILPYILRSDRLINEKQVIYLFILGFLVFSVILRIFLEDPFLKNK